MKPITALELCRTLKAHLNLCSEHKEVLDEAPFYPTSPLTIARLLDGVIDGNGTFYPPQVITLLDPPPGLERLRKPPAAPFIQYAKNDRVCVAYGGYPLQSATVLNHKQGADVVQVHCDGYSEGSVTGYHRNFLSPLTDQKVEPVCAVCRRIILKIRRGRGGCRCAVSTPADPRTIFGP